LLSEPLGSSPLEAEPGDKVTLCCHHDLYRASYIFWFKHISTSVPLLVGCKQFTLSGQTQSCYFSPESERMVMSVHRKNTSLTIPRVSVSDTGLYYCSFIKLDKVIFSNSSYLHVKVNRVPEGNETLTTNSNSTEDLPGLCSTKDAVSSSVLMMLSVISGVMNMIMIPLFVTIIIQKHRTHR
ncbi:Ig kappa chain V19-17-like, partial [Clarias magur]